MNNKTKKALVIVSAIVVILGIAFYLFATSGITASDLKDMPTCNTAQAEQSIGCVNR